MISKGSRSKEPYRSIENILQTDIAAYYLGIKSLPTLINSPLRNDNKPSFALYCPKDTEVNYKDFSTGEAGTIWTLLSKMWNCSFQETIEKVQHDIGNRFNSTRTYKFCKKTSTEIQCKVREWKQHDIDYWNSFGISLKWLKYAEVYPISHKIITKNGIRSAFKADKYAYAYVEHKEGMVTLKIYQPFNQNGFKWSNNHDKSVVSLWTKVPEKGEKICICSSLKDALCLWANTGIPSLALQGEGFELSNTAINELKRRFERIFICFDNDETGLRDGIMLSSKTDFINVVLPSFEGGKDVSDLFKIKGKKEFIQIVKPLFN